MVTVTQDSVNLHFQVLSHSYFIQNKLVFYTLWRTEDFTVLATKMRHSTQSTFIRGVIQIITKDLAWALWLDHLCYLLDWTLMHSFMRLDMLCDVTLAIRFILN